MNEMNILLCWVFAVIFSCGVYADDVPQDDIGAQKFDLMTCVSETTQSCIDDDCLNSDQVDCQDNCKKLAQEKCQQQLNE